ncbi:Glycosyltransferase involved in cell wall bisynthesis [Mucilaginibacter mallensis]|uniref:Glycosyltransferase involved in cell wall bisynthesis n=1 Tax=Mucilaginibacter mallensis TaxID=652787 RepID=A0A1H1S0S0_MUCMA|nr:glycosyltransferase family 1 protein [Mucilaginibacter mallensis]SDS41416.1 Glycosyltransferase involved in cell wall bisynthesis [Mucilaginibacter mallensis]
MKIGYDAKRAFLNNTGLGNYSRWLIKAIAAHYPGNEYFLYTPRIKLNSRLSFLSQYKNLITITPESKFFTSWWRSKGIVKDLKRDGIEIYHGLSHELPSGTDKSGIRSVVTIHDLIFMRLPGNFGIISRKIYEAKVKYACKVADKIVAISQKTKDDIIELLGTDAVKIEVIYQSIDPIFTITQSEEQKEAASSKYNLPAQFLLSVGTIEPRKNLLLLAKALKYVDVIPLVVVGRPTKYLDEVKQYLTANNLINRAIFLHDVEFADLPAIYQLASAFIYPSRYEGFGLPVLEALNSGVPVIAATGSCLEEAGGPHSLYVNPDDEKDLAEKVSLILSDNALKQNMIAQGLQYAANFAQDKLSAQLMQLYKNL